jgi:hypothetical protein
LHINMSGKRVVVTSGTRRIGRPIIGRVVDVGNTAQANTFISTASIDSQAECLAKYLITRLSKRNFTSSGLIGRRLTQRAKLRLSRVRLK